VRRYLGFFGPRTAGWQAPEAEALRGVVPASPRRAYDVRKAIDGICDLGSVQELKRDFGRAAVTALGRIAGRPVAIVANQPMHLAGSIDAEAAIKSARFAQLSDAFGLPVLLLCDTPGLMVGPEAERSGIVRHGSRLLMALRMRACR
jgi:Acetyl-CoA carboxylase, carboxyltransferase component (subunits alpha and beta)